MISVGAWISGIGLSCMEILCGPSNTIAFIVVGAMAVLLHTRHKEVTLIRILKECKQVDDYKCVNI